MKSLLVTDETDDTDCSDRVNESRHVRNFESSTQTIKNDLELFTFIGCL